MPVWLRQVRTVALVFAWTIALIVLATASSANGPEIGYHGGAIYPIDSRDIQLVSEEVSIDMRSGGSKPNARCVYLLRNLSDRTRKLRMSFVLPPPYSGDPGEVRAMTNLYRFHVVQDRKPRRVRFAPFHPDKWRHYRVPEECDSLPVWTMTLGPRATSTIEMSYVVEWSVGCEGDSDEYENCSAATTYFTRAAARWAGRIEHAVFTFVLDEYTRSSLTSDPTVIRPSGWAMVPKGVRWEFRNWEPEEDLFIGAPYSAVYSR